MSKPITGSVLANLPGVANSGDVRAAGLIAALTIATILAIYHQTTGAMVSIWERSDTFAHCFLIAPISAWLIWRQRKQLIALGHRPNRWVLLLLVGLGFGWLLAALAHVMVFQQYFLVAMIPIAVWAIMGNQLASAVAFPLAYLLLTVPFGEVFLPVMINFTADFTVAALQLTGIPVYREGTFFTLPSGNWSVVEACSGLRYLIASFTLGTLYAYLTYRSMKRRLAFIALSVVVPIIANGLRAYMIVMMGHLSDMRVAVGADHLLYGWIFFGLVMLLLFWIGSYWREDEQSDNNDDVNVSHTAETTSLKSTAAVAVAVIAVSLLWPAYASYLDRDAGIADNGRTDIAGIPGKWEAATTPLSSWKPKYIGTPAQFLRTYQNDTRSVSIYVIEYRKQRPESQLVTTANVLVPGADPEWRNVREETRSIELGSQRLTVRQNQLHSPSQKLLLWRWYRLAGEETVSPQMAKLILAKHKLLARGDDGAEIIIATQYEDRADEAVSVLQAFLDDMMPTIRKGLVDAAGQ
jgi:exosortase A